MAKINYHIVSFRDVTLNLKEGNCLPCRKPNNNMLYIDCRSNHPPNVIQKQPRTQGLVKTYQNIVLERLLWIITA